MGRGSDAYVYICSDKVWETQVGEGAWAAVRPGLRYQHCTLELSEAARMLRDGFQKKGVY